MLSEIQVFGLDFTSTFPEWMQNVNIIDEILKGLIIGIIVSAPMGPVGILTVQRTLNKGRWEGFATGVGASTSDFIYALITGYGMSFVVDIINNPAIALIIKLVSGVLLFAFGLYTYRSIPKNSVKDDISITTNSTDKPDLKSYAMSGFVVTVSNPLIIFMFLALFGQFTFIIVDNIIPQIFGYIAIIGGALLWWLALTWVVNRVRAHFNNKVLWWINRIIGIIVMVVSGLYFVYTATGHAIPFEL